MKRMLVLILLVASLGLVAGCGTASAGGSGSTPVASSTAAAANCQEVNMEASGPGKGQFAPNTCTVPTGTRINFVDQTPSPVSIYYGTNEVFQADANGPVALNHSGGVTVYPSDSYGVLFVATGTFNITALPAAPSPQMNFTITVVNP